MLARGARAEERSSESTLQVGIKAYRQLLLTTMADEGAVGATSSRDSLLRRSMRAFMGPVAALSRAHNAEAHDGLDDVQNEDANQGLTSSESASTDHGELENDTGVENHLQAVFKDATKDSMSAENAAPSSSPHTRSSGKTGPLVAPRRSLVPKTLSRRVSGVRIVGRTFRKRVAVVEHPNSPWIAEVWGISEDDDVEDPMPSERVRLQRIEVYLEEAKSEDPEARIVGLRCIRHLFMASGRVPIWLLLESDLHSSLIENLKSGADEKLLFETMWVVAQLAKTRSRANMMALLNKDAIGETARILDMFVSPRVSEQSLRALSRLARTSLDVRDQILANEIVIPVLTRISVATGPTSMYCALASAICSLVQGSPAPSTDAVVDPLMPTLARLFEIQDIHAINSVLFSLTYLSESNPSSLTTMVELGMTPKVAAALDGTLAQTLKDFEMSGSPDHDENEDREDTELMLLTPALRTVVGVASTGEDFIQAILDTDAAGSIVQLIEHPRRDIRVLASKALANMSLGSQAQIQILLDYDLAKLLQNHFEREVHVTVKKGIATFLANVCTRGSSEQISEVTSHGAVRIMWHVASLINVGRTTDLVVSATEAVLAKIDPANIRQVLIDIEESGTFEVLDRQDISEDYFERLTEAMFMAESRIVD